VRHRLTTSNLNSSNFLASGLIVGDDLDEVADQLIARHVVGRRCEVGRRTAAPMLRTDDVAVRSPFRRFARLRGYLVIIAADIASLGRSSAFLAAS
jgi:hypothetical protein